LSSRSYHHGDLKSALLKAAQHILNKKGIDALSLRAIAAEAGVSHMAPYAHFKNKSQLYQAVATLGFTELGERMSLVQNDSPKTRELILLYGAQYIDFAIHHPQMYRLMLSQTHPGKHLESDPQVDQSVLDELQTASLRPYTLLHDGFAHYESDKNKVKIQAQGAWAIVHGIAALMIEGHIEIDEGMTTKEYLATAAMQI
jgi:AcrR family transcriptional regulator